jgi:hypothetical protein
MKKILAVLLMLSLVAPVAADAKKHGKHGKHHKTTVLKGSFRAIGADGAYTDKKFGKAQLVDNRKRDKLSVHLRKLAPKTAYMFALYSVPKGTPRCREDAPGGTQETAFPPKTKTTNKRGNLNAKQKSKTFKAKRSKRYFVLVSQGADPVACAKLDRKGKGHGKKKHGKKKHHGKKPAKGKRPERPAHGKRREDKPAKDKPARAEDKRKGPKKP